jgi:Tol biopolymer transport system component
MFDRFRVSSRQTTFSEMRQPAAPAAGALQSSPEYLLIRRSWSPNGKHFIRIYDLQRGISTRLTDSGDEHYPLWSRDGKRIIVGPGREILVEPFPGPGRRIQISLGGGAQPRWSHDGRQIFFIQPDRKLIAVSFESASRTGNTMSRPTVVF